MSHDVLVVYSNLTLLYDGIQQPFKSDESITLETLAHTTECSWLASSLYSIWYFELLQSAVCDVKGANFPDVGMECGCRVLASVSLPV